MSVWRLLRRLGIVDDPDLGDLQIIGGDGDSIEYWVVDKVGSNTYLIETEEGHLIPLNVVASPHGMYVVENRREEPGGGS